MFCKMGKMSVFRYHAENYVLKSYRFTHECAI